MLSHTSVYFVITKFILSLSCTKHYTIQRVFSDCNLMFSFLFNRLQSKARTIDQMIHFWICKRSTIGQLNVKAAMAEKKK